MVFAEKVWISFFNFRVRIHLVFLIIPQNYDFFYRIYSNRKGGVGFG